jgi:negative regulator of flagellin synthesis FlgM
MVDSVKFGLAKPVPPAALRGAKYAAPIHAKNADTHLSAPHSLSLASALAQKGPPFDADKVASLKAAIASGNYQINLGNIADGMIRFGFSDHA